MSTGQIGILAAIIVYLAAMVYVGFYFSKKGGGDSADEGEDLPQIVQELVEESHMGFSLLIRGAARVALAPCLTRRGG